MVFVVRLIHAGRFRKGLIRLPVLADFRLVGFTISDGLPHVLDGQVAVETETLRDVADRMISDYGARRDAALDGTRALLTLLYQTYHTG